MVGMGDAAKKLFAEALALSDDEQAELADRLFERLYPRETEAWAQELRRRVDHALSDDWKGEPLEASHANLLAKLDRMRRPA